ncbi:flagellar type III secretion system pore protein FliP [candidate division KSB1 bacterium]|nr:flagellar type III secretion system pore protein FliP [candidate division KSB1 bacterium]
MKAKRFFQIIMLVVVLVMLGGSALAQQPIPKLTIGVDQANSPKDVAVTLQIVALMTILSLAPAILITMTSFTRIIVILNFLRQASGTQAMPPTQLIIGLSLFLTFFIMGPVFENINTNALQPYLKEEITARKAFDEAVQPLKKFMLNQTREKDIALFFKIAKLDKPKNASEVQMRILIPAFIISELRIAFQIGFILYLPFLMIDMIVASVLMSMGMLMLPPIMISLPFKILLFVLVDGWYLVVESIVAGFKV